MYEFQESGSPNIALQERPFLAKFNSELDPAREHARRNFKFIGLIN